MFMDQRTVKKMDIDKCWGFVSNNVLCLKHVSKKLIISSALVASKSVAYIYLINTYNSISTQMYKRNVCDM